MSLTFAFSRKFLLLRINAFHYKFKLKRYIEDLQGSFFSGTRCTHSQVIFKTQNSLTIKEKLINAGITPMQKDQVFQI